MIVPILPSGISRAIKAAGGQETLAAALNVSQQFISRCLLQGWVPTHHAIQIETLYGIPRCELISPRLRMLFCDDREVA